LILLAPFQFIISVLAWIISLSDRLMIQHILKDTAQVGLYGVGYTFGSAILFILAPIQTAWRPYIYSVYVEDVKLYDRQMGLFFAYFVWICAGSFLVISILAPLMINILTPTFYHKAGQIVTLILLGQILASISNYFLPTFFINNKMQDVTLIYLLSAAVNVILNLFLITDYGILGAASATIASYGLMFVLIVYRSQSIRKIRIDYRQILCVIIITAIAWRLLLYIKFATMYITLSFRLFIVLAVISLVSIVLKRHKLKQIKVDDDYESSF
jgi:O-antigen/teichoic acid export membrane protein